MPTLTIDATTQQLDRIKTALGLATNAEVKTWIINTVKQAVKSAEASAVAQAEDTKIQQAIEARQTALQAKEAEPDVELT